MHVSTTTMYMKWIQETINPIIITAAMMSVAIYKY